MNFVKEILSAIFTRKKIMVWIAAVIIAVLAAVFGISPQEIKDAVNDAPQIELPTQPPVKK